ncbi:AlpA family phage regulatory protein [Vibrio cholerae]
MNDGEFPQSVSLGERAIAWVESEVDEWMEMRLERR